MRIENIGTKPSLIQSWIDDGDLASTPITTLAPFDVAPLVFRISPKTHKAIRLRYTGNSLPGDRESLFWLNVMEVRPTPASAEGSAVIEFSYRNRLRLFFRPDNLAGQRSNAAEKLEWKLVPHQSGYALQVHNPTPYHISLTSVALIGKQERYEKAENRDINDSLLFPIQTKQFVLPGLKVIPSGPLKVEFVEVNDHGTDAKQSTDL